MMSTHRLCSREGSGAAPGSGAPYPLPTAFVRLVQEKVGEVLVGLLGQQDREAADAAASTLHWVVATLAGLKQEAASSTSTSSNTWARTVCSYWLVPSSSTTTTEGYRCWHVLCTWGGSMPFTRLVQAARPTRLRGMAALQHLLHCKSSLRAIQLVRLLCHCLVLRCNMGARLVYFICSTLFEGPCQDTTPLKQHTHAHDIR